jgi:hypothetical protein
LEKEYNSKDGLSNSHSNIKDYNMNMRVIVRCIFFIVSIVISARIDASSGYSQSLIHAQSYMHEQVALIIASLGLVAGGTFLVSKTSNGIINKLCSVIGGFSMIGIGIGTAVFSKVIIYTLQDMLAQASK